MACSPVAPPTQEGFLDFIRTIMGIPAEALPDTSPYIPLAFCESLAEVNTDFCAIAPFIYTQMVYYLAGNTIINIALDQIVPPATKPFPFPGTKVPYFTYLRQQWNINGFVSGVVSSASDEGTSSSFVVPDSLSGLMLSDLQNLKTPYGRQYLAWAQKYGPSIWGIS